MSNFQLNPGAMPAAPAARTERVRIGAISLFTLVVVICLAVLAVLSLSTANASLTMSQRQANAMTELYQDERAAQEFVAGVDAILVAARDGEVARTMNAQVANEILLGLSQSAKASGSGEDADTVRLAQDDEGNYVFDENGYLVVEEQESVLKSRAGEVGALAVQAGLDDLCQSAREAAGGDVQVFANVTDNKVAAEFNCQNGRLLNVVITIRNNGTYRIDRWKMSAVQNEEQPDGQLLIIDE